jgi:RHS repeat-associated protein
MDDTPVAVVEGGVVYYVRVDHIGRPVFATDSAGNKVWEATYLPFGEVLTSTGANTNLRFPGQWFQAESGLHQNWMRDYDPTTGRYMQADPLGLVDGASVYGYAGQNPGRYVDQYGLEKWKWDGQGDIGFCAYYDRLASENPHCNYFPAAADICRGDSRIVNSATNLALAEAWQSNRTSRSQSQVLTSIRMKLIYYDYQNRNMGHIDENGCTCGDDVDLYHLLSFSEAGLNNAFYGGNWWRQDTWPNPVPYDPRDPLK